MDTDFQERLKLLRSAVAETLPRQIARDNTEFSYTALRELHGAGMMTGVRFEPVGNFYICVVNPRITFAGMEYLAELERRAVPASA